MSRKGPHGQEPPASNSLAVEKYSVHALHSIVEEKDFVSPFRAAAQALTLAHQVAFDSQGFQFSALRDPRIDQADEELEFVEAELNRSRQWSEHQTAVNQESLYSPAGREEQCLPYKAKSVVHRFQHGLKPHVHFAPNTEHHVRGTLVLQFNSLGTPVPTAELPNPACREGSVQLAGPSHVGPSSGILPQASVIAQVCCQHDRGGALQVNENLAPEMHLYYIGLDGAPPSQETPQKTALPTGNPVAVWLPVPALEIRSYLEEHPDQDVFVFFDTHDHVRWRKRESAWGIHEIVLDAIRHSTVQPVLEVRVLRRPLPDLPVLQLVLSGANIPSGWSTVPIDLRQVGHDICTIGVPGDSSSYEIALRALQNCRAPAAIPHEVARSRWNLGPPGVDITDPFRPDALALEPAVVCTRVHSLWQESSNDGSGPTSSESEAASSSDDELFHCAAHECDEHSTDFVVAFHAVGHHPWTESLPRLAPPESIARAAAQRMASLTGKAGWRTQFLWRQPWVPGIDLHCLVSPRREGPSQISNIFLADFRRIFGPDLRNLAALNALLNTPQSAEAMCIAARKKLLE